MRPIPMTLKVLRGAGMGMSAGLFTTYIIRGEWLFAAIWAASFAIQAGTMLVFDRKRRQLQGQGTMSGWREHEAGRDRGDHHDPDPDEGAGHHSRVARALNAINPQPGQDSRESSRVDPVVAYKVGRLGGDGVAYSGVQGSAMSTEFLKADCNGGYADHESPKLDCQCGHYACATQDHSRLSSLGGHSVLFKVELAGKVLADGEGVYRASHQRIMGCYLSPFCSVCGVETTTTLARPEMGGVPESEQHLSWIPLCQRCCDVVDRAQEIHRMTLVDAQGYFGMEVELVPFEGWGE